MRAQFKHNRKAMTKEKERQFRWNEQFFVQALSGEYEIVSL